MKKRLCRTVAGGLLLLGMLLCLGGCGRKKEPITLTMWHIYGGQTDSPLNDLIEEFNQTAGKEEGIVIQPTMVSNTNTIHESVLAAANKDLGASELPDLFSSYPKTVLAMPDPSVLMDYRDYFTDTELSAFVPSFLEEGVIDGRQLILPVAKSTEILFVDKTIFDRFAAETGADQEDMKTWEGLYRLSEQYAEWSGGKTFFVHDYHFNYFQVGVESLGEDFFDGDKMAFGDKMKEVWKPYADAALTGGLWLQEGYATEPLRTGEAVVSVASSASVLYYEDIVTYPDNISEPIEIIARPVPVFENGENLVMQRGAGVCAVKSTPEREKAAAFFLKWLTEPRKNVELAVAAGYMPVTEEAFNYLPEELEKLTSQKYKSLYEAFIDTQENFTFYTAPQLTSYLDMETRFEKNTRRILQEGREEYLEKTSGEAEAALSEEEKEQLQEEISDSCYEKLHKVF